MVFVGVIPRIYDLVPLLNSILSITMVSFLVYVNSKVDVIRLSSLQKALEKLGIFKQAIESTSDHVVITDENGVILFANKSSQRITGFSSKDMLGNTPRLWRGNEQRFL